ncbi:BrnT family toxin [[Limnothrix rosea] IAM M-220]|uniref:BrnT family toxin n=1 Tax=[Limnothrix rosea] IAM M-220 TaxID=454133 RepID=UPI00095D9782|nr:BrnT family toxin [[Limnothrix rosea] IAM M-220]OKH14666.1 toxin [[Limnothrix rosea] IAM M-220]
MPNNQSFEFDENKSQTNKQKHGLDFIEAQVLWDDNELIQIRGTSDNEPRFLVIGKIKDKYWTAVITYRLDNIRIISVRRSRINEMRWYES